MAKEASRIQDYLNLLSFKLSCPGNALKKAETLLRMMLGSKEILRFRAKIPTNPDFWPHTVLLTHYFFVY
jgi:hypothetical protein